jgi:hypothetical protein
LAGLGGVDIHTYNDLAFWSACRKGRLEIARWLVSVESCLNGKVVHNAHLRSWSRARAAWCSWVL